MISRVEYWRVKPGPNLSVSEWSVFCHGVHTQTVWPSLAHRSLLLLTTGEAGIDCEQFTVFQSNKKRGPWSVWTAEFPSTCYEKYWLYSSTSPHLSLIQIEIFHGPCCSINPVEAVQEETNKQHSAKFGTFDELNKAEQILSKGNKNKPAS